MTMGVSDKCPHGPVDAVRSGPVGGGPPAAGGRDSDAGAPRYTQATTNHGTTTSAIRVASQPFGTATSAEGDDEGASGRGAAIMNLFILVNTRHPHHTLPRYS